MKILIILSILFWVVCGWSQAENYYWINSAGGLYGQATNWNPQGVPGLDGGDTVWFTLNAAYTVTFDKLYTNETLYADGSDVTLDLAGYTYDLHYSPEGSRSAVIGLYNASSLTVLNGAVYSREVSIGQYDDSVGQFILSGSDTQWTTLYEGEWHGVWIGEFGNATLSVLDNAKFIHGHGLSAFALDSDAVIEVDGLESEWYVNGQFDMSNYGKTTTHVRNGGLIKIGKLTMGLHASSSANITVSSVNQLESELILRSSNETSLTIGQSGNASIQLYNSKLWNQGMMVIGENAGSNGLLELHQGTWVDCHKSVAVGGSFDGPGGIGHIRIIDDIRDDEIGVRFEAAHLVGQSIKVWRQGTITMNGGEIKAEYGSSQANPILLEGGTLEGNGTIRAYVENNGGVVAPWDYEGNKALGIGYNYSQDMAGVLKIRIAGREPISEYAQLQVTNENFGQVALDGMLEVELADGFVPNPEDQFEIIVAKNITGTLRNAVSKYVFKGGSFDVIYYNTEPLDSVILTNYSPIPSCPQYPMADLTKDCKVNLADLAVLANQWLMCNLLPQSECFE